MQLLITNGTFYVDNLKFCYCEAGNGRPSIPTGHYEVFTQFSPEHGAVLPDVVDLGWVGASSGCDVVLGGVRGRNGIVPSTNCLGRLLALIENTEGIGKSVRLEVR